MKKLLSVLFSALLLMPCASRATEGAYLSGEDLESLQPAYEAFLDAVADVLIARDLLSPAEEEAWKLFQVGDFTQNGGYGSIAVMYTPELLSFADASVFARKFSAQTQAGTVVLETLQRYVEKTSPLPGLPLDAALLDTTATDLACRFRWTASGGSLIMWDGAQAELVNVGATYVSDGRPLYWNAPPVRGITEILTLTLLHPTEDMTLAQVALTVRGGDDCWEPEVLE